MRVDDVIAALEPLDDFERRQALIDLSETFVPVPERIAERPFEAARRVPGCESEAFVWVLPGPGGTIETYFAVENPFGVSARALCAVLTRALHGAPVGEALELSDDLVYRLFGRDLSMGKSLGLIGIVASVRAQAARLAADP